MENYTISIRSDVFKRFEAALHISESPLTPEQFIESMIINYTNSVLLIPTTGEQSAMSQLTLSKTGSQIEDRDILNSKAKEKVMRWSQKSNSFPYIFIRSFLILTRQNVNGSVHRTDLYSKIKELYPEIENRTLTSNYAQLKKDYDHSNGCVFNDNKGLVTISAEYRTWIEFYKKSFENF